MARRSSAKPVPQSVRQVVSFFHRSPSADGLSVLSARDRWHFAIVEGAVFYQAVLRLEIQPACAQGLDAAFAEGRGGAGEIVVGGAVNAVACHILAASPYKSYDSAATLEKAQADQVRTATAKPAPIHPASEIPSSPTRHCERRPKKSISARNSARAAVPSPGTSRFVAAIITFFPVCSLEMNSNTLAL